jgi:hypothetical protein
MAKNKITDAVSVSDVIDPKYIAVLADYTDKEKEAFLKLSPEDKEAEIAFLLSLQSSATAKTDVEFKDVKPEKENINILTAGGPGLRAGAKIRAFLMGTVHVFSKEFKENWKEFQGENATFYYNNYLKFRGLDGKEFGIWGSATLRMLEKVPTHASLPTMVEVDPMVEISYIGKIEGRDRLESEFGIILKQGNSAHVFVAKVAATSQYNAYVKGCVNSLNSPTPIENGAGPLITREEATRSNYEKLMALQNNGSQISGALSQ